MNTWPESHPQRVWIFYKVCCRGVSWEPDEEWEHKVLVRKACRLTNSFQTFKHCLTSEDGGCAPRIEFHSHLGRYCTFGKFSFEEGYYETWDALSSIYIGIVFQKWSLSLSLMLWLCTLIFATLTYLNPIYSTCFASEWLGYISQEK